MRIISGNLRGRKLVSAEADGLRPAMGRTREALFSILESAGLIWERRNILDLFAGSGSLAFECLSRGAESAWMVDSSPTAIACLRRNATSFNVIGQSRVFQMDALRFLRKNIMVFDLIFIDPPYGQSLITPCLKLITANNWLKDGGFVAAEIEKEAKLIVPPELTELTARVFGRTNLHIWIKQ